MRQLSDFKVILRLLAGHELQPHADAALEEVDWNSLINNLRTNTLPYLHFRIESLHLEAQVPAAVWTQLADARMHTRLRHLRIVSELKLIGGKFQEKRIDCLLLKGAELQYRLYTDPTTRPMADIDLMVAPEVLMLAGESLEECGFKARYPAEEETPITSRPAPWEEVVYYKALGNSWLMVELKSRAERTPLGRRKSWRRLWGNSIEADLPYPGFRVLCPQDLISELALHAVYHHACESALLWLLDIHLLLEKCADEINWQQLAADCRNTGSFEVVAFTLHLVSHWFDCDLKPHASLPISTAKISEMEPIAWSQCFDNGVRRKPPPSVLHTLAAGDMRRVLEFGIKRLKLWSSKGYIKGDDKNRALSRASVGTKRVARDFKTYLAAWREGGLRPSVIRSAIEVDRRSKRLRSLFESLDAP